MIVAVQCTITKIIFHFFLYAKMLLKNKKPKSNRTTLEKLNMHMNI